MMKHRWIATATEVFGKTKYPPNDLEVALLAERMALLEAAGLQGLNQRLAQANRKIFDIIAELNLAVMLVQHRGKSRIEYEPPDYRPRPIDFRVTQNGAVIHLQMKRFGDLERDNRRSAMYERIKREAAGIDVGKFFAITMNEEFPEAHVAGLVELLRTVAPSANDGHACDFKVGDAVLASLEFWSPRSVSLAHLTLGAASDAGAVNITGLAADQIRASMRNAAGAFNLPVDSKNLNLVVAESDRHHDIDVCEACFGTEEELFSANGRHSWHRLDDGVFAEAGIADRVIGLILLRRSDPAKPLSKYETQFMINERHLNWVDHVAKAIPIAKVMRYNMRP